MHVIRRMHEVLSMDLLMWNRVWIYSRRKAFPWMKWDARDATLFGRSPGGVATACEGSHLCSHWAQSSISPSRLIMSVTAWLAAPIAYPPSTSQQLLGVRGLVYSPQALNGAEVHGADACTTDLSSRFAASFTKEGLHMHEHLSSQYVVHSWLG